MGRVTSASLAGAGGEAMLATAAIVAIERAPLGGGGTITASAVLTANDVVALAGAGAMTAFVSPPGTSATMVGAGGLSASLALEAAIFPALAGAGAVATAGTSVLRVSCLLAAAGGFGGPFSLDFSQDFQTGSGPVLRLLAHATASFAGTGSETAILAPWTAFSTLSGAGGLE